MSAEIGRVIAGKYRIDALLGEGSMGSVFAAEQVALRKPVAIKVMHAELAADRSFAQRFHHEAQATSRLSHPNSILVTDFGEDTDGLLYLVMERVTGTSLGELMTSGPWMSERRAAQLMLQALSALAVAHDAGIVHRDLKPDNMLVVETVDDDDNPVDVLKVCDFGIASMLSNQIAVPSSASANAAPLRRGARLTAVGSVIGTPAYMSPEQAQGLESDARSDLYSIGVVLYELLAGQVPFTSDTLEGIIEKQISAQPLAPRQLRPQVSVQIQAICLKALEKDPARRHENARAMRAELRDFLLSTEGDRSDYLMPASISTPLHMPPGTTLLPRTSADSINAAASATAVQVTGMHAVAEATNRAPIADTLAGTRVATPPVTSRPALRALVGVLGLAATLAVGGALWHRQSSTPSERVNAISVPGEPTRVTAPPSEPTAERATKDPSIEFAATPSSAKPRETAPETKLPSVVAVTSATTATTTPAEPSNASAGSAVVTAEPATTSVVPVATAAAVVAVAPTVSAEVAATAPPFTPERGRAVASFGSLGGLARGNALPLLTRVSFTSCYQAQLRTLGRNEVGNGAAHIEVDEAGKVQVLSVSLPAALRPASACVSRQLQGQMMTAPDTGTALVDINIVFGIQ